MSGRDLPFDEIKERVEGIREARGRSDETLRDQIRVGARMVFMGLNNRVLNEGRDLQDFIAKIYSKCDTQTRVNVQGWKRDVEAILRERESFAAGALAGEDTDIDTPDQHIGRITDFSRRIQNLCPLVTRLDVIWQQVNALYESIRSAEEGR